MKTKAGVSAIALHPGVLHALDVVDLIWRETFGVQAVVTSLGDGEHSEGSLHYGVEADTRVRAFDVRTRDLDPTQRAEVAQRAREALGGAFDVVDEPTHLHVELDITKLRRVLSSGSL